MTGASALLSNAQVEAPAQLLPWLSYSTCARVLHLKSDLPLRVASTAPYGGGIRKVRHILSLKVDESLECQRPERFARARTRGMELDEPFVCLLTGVSLDCAKVAAREAPDMRAVAVVTAGGRNLCVVGLSPAWNAPGCGTINIIAIVDARLSDAALLNLLTVTTEAKALALRERGVLTEEGFPATGTSTDAVVVACTGNGPSQRYGGPLTVPGHLVGGAVLAATRAALDDCSIGRGQA